MIEFKGTYIKPEAVTFISNVIMTNDQKFKEVPHVFQAWVGGSNFTYAYHTPQAAEKGRTELYEAVNGKGKPVAEGQRDN